ncbi:hypothetical protein PENANT_c010G07317 [Penicillium antarcticum]|uniref:Calcineurin-like phosphoesterase domain-containing protein n=1 Tax=Penicillium antarcticum TaxID=416450 RepID=A0A1V6Q8D1_9EURO|nr:uncharacterized protein N7508_000629 [Penicillium antarcticum]KAJ5320346.1 hypothetical protein N7508_000629 [Penicillium antarcticum]OQD85490.1 hypothetical protein PENANT_c010G07317 [Penicillium antarcticum]
MTSTKPPDKIFPITTFLSNLPINLIQQPLQSSRGNGPSGRLVIIGDVHGMRQSLEALLDKVSFNKSNGDHLILVGDLVNKGPDSPGVVDLAIKLGASAVRGNHENAVLNAVSEINNMWDSRESQLHPNDLSDGPAAPENSDTNPVGNPVRAKYNSGAPEIKMRASPATQSTAMALSKHHLEWLASLPLILRIDLPHNLTSSLGYTLIVAHAGLVPGITLEEQDPHAVMHVRSLVNESGNEYRFTPTETFGEESWAVEWDRWQESLASKTTVIFGHDARRRLQLGKYTIGLDSACLYGNQLSAVVFEARDRRLYHEIVQVECADTPVTPTVPAKEGESNTDKTEEHV